MIRFRLLGPLVLVLAFSIPALVQAQQTAPPISQVVVIDTAGKTDVLLGEAKKNQKIFERLGIQAKRRYLQASLAGDATGNLAVVIEYPSLAAMAAAQEKLAGDAEWQKYIDKIQSSGMSVQSNAIWVEITP